MYKLANVQIIAKIRIGIKIKVINLDGNGTIQRVPRVETLFAHSIIINRRYALIASAMPIERYEDHV